MLYTIQELAKPSRDQDTSMIIAEVSLAMKAAYDDFPKQVAWQNVRLETIHEDTGSWIHHGRVIGLMLCTDDEHYRKVVRRVMCKNGAVDLAKIKAKWDELTEFSAAAIVQRAEESARDRKAWDIRGQVEAVAKELGLQNVQVRATASFDQRERVQLHMDLTKDEAVAILQAMAARS